MQQQRGVSVQQRRRAIPRCSLRAVSPCTNTAGKPRRGLRAGGRPSNSGPAVTPRSGAARPAAPWSVPTARTRTCAECGTGLRGAPDLTGLRQVRPRPFTRLAPRGAHERHGARSAKQAVHGHGVHVPAAVMLAPPPPSLRCAHPLRLLLPPFPACCSPAPPRGPSPAPSCRSSDGPARQEQRWHPLCPSLCPSRARRRSRPPRARRLAGARRSRGLRPRC